MTTRSAKHRATAPTMRIVRSVARAHGVDPVALTPPLGAVIDTDALDDMLGDASTDVAISFDYLDCRVTVTADDVVVDGPDADGAHQGLHDDD